MPLASSKLQTYLLNPEHPRGGSKARLLVSLGYSAADYHRLEADLRDQHLVADVVEESASDYGRSYVIATPVNTPGGRTVLFRSVWQIDSGTDYPRLIPMYPER